VSDAFGQLVGRARAEHLPGVLEATCHRFRGHYEGDMQAYRQPPEDLSSFDPLLIARARLLERGVAADQLDGIERRAGEEMASLLTTVRAEPMPAPEMATSHVFTDACGPA
jgi:acetoin:2,6-dichlorophenolindophenol oxidoreductase subunit alpha